MHPTARRVLLRMLRWMRYHPGTVLLAFLCGPWLLGFPGLTDYPRLLSLLVDVEGRDGYSPRALLLALGSGERLAQGVSVLAGGCAHAPHLAASRNHGHAAHSRAG